MFQHGEENLPKGEDGFPILDETIDLMDTWGAMEKLVDVGLVRAIGLSNFNSKQVVNKQNFQEFYVNFKIKFI